MSKTVCRRRRLPGLGAVVTAETLSDTWGHRDFRSPQIPVSLLDICFKHGSTNRRTLCWRKWGYSLLRGDQRWKGKGGEDDRSIISTRRYPGWLTNPCQHKPDRTIGVNSYSNVFGKYPFKKCVFKPLQFKLPAHILINSRTPYPEFTYNLYQQNIDKA